MLDNINVTVPNGEPLAAEGISHIKDTNTNKEYLFYTLNEIVKDGMTLMYVGEVSNTPDGAVIDDDTWRNLQQLMLRLSNGEKIPEITYLPLQGVEFKVGQPRKIALDANKKQALKDNQLTSTIAETQNVPEDAPAKESTQFFDATIPNDASATKEEPAVAPNIFDQPMQPAFANQTITPPEEDPIKEPASVPAESTQTVEQPASESATATLNTTLKNEINDMSLDTGAVLESVDIPSGEVSEEEAMKALETLNKYFAQKKDKTHDTSKPVPLSSEPSAPIAADNANTTLSEDVPAIDSSLAQGVPMTANTLVTQPEPVVPETPPEESAVSFSEPAKSLTLTPPGMPPSLADNAEESVIPSAEAQSLEQQNKALEPEVSVLDNSDNNAVYTAYASQEAQKQNEEIPEPAVTMPLTSSTPGSMPNAEALGGMLTPNQLPSQNMTI